jgi:Ser/Thr protein kinase RdoA (MazF antagonist)
MTAMQPSPIELEPDIALAAEVAREFGISPHRIERRSGNTTALWRVDADGSFVLRKHPADALPRILTVHHLLDFLATGHHAYAPKVVRAPNGDDVVERDDGAYELLTYLEGEAGTAETFDWDDDPYLTSAAELLADLQLTLRDYTPPAGANWWQAKPTPPQPVVEAQLRKQRSQESASILATLPLMYRYLDAEMPAGLSRHVVHNDFGWYNVLRKGDTALAVIDFDTAHVNTELHDVAYALYAFAPIRGSIGPRPRTLDRTAQRVDLFLRAYEDRLGERVPVSAGALFDAAAKRVALLEADLLVGTFASDERSARLSSHMVGYADWMDWYAKTRLGLVTALQSRQS